MFRATWKKTNSTNSTQDELERDLTVLGEIYKREHDTKDGIDDPKNPKKSDQKFDIKTKTLKGSGNILSPHTSVYQALNDPSLNSDIFSGKTGLTKEKLNLLEKDCVNGSQIQVSFTKSDLKHLEESNNLDFSVTSWQNISTFLDTSNDDHISSDKAHMEVSLTLSTDQVNIISSGNNSPTYKNEEMLGLSPNRTGSPNSGSILSSSSGQEEEKTIEKILDQNDAVKRSKSMFEKKRKRELLSEDEDDESTDTDLERTVDSSTITSSFVMPRVSIISKSKMDSTNVRTQCITKIKIIGDNDECLLKRFQTYKKTLTHIEFISSIDEKADLIIIVLDENNYMLPKLTKTYCIPIIVSKSKLHLVRKIPKALKLCGPIQLSSLNDDLIHLINFLSNINDAQLWKHFVSSPGNTQIDKSSTISDLNTSLVGFQSTLNDIELNSNEDECSDKKGKSSELHTYAVVALAVGAISISVFIFIRSLSNDKIALTHLDQRSQNSSPSTNFETGKHITKKLNEYLLIGLKQFQLDLDEAFSQFISKSVLYYHKTKLLLYQYFYF